MIKLSVSFSDIGIDSVESITEEDAFDMFIDFLEKQFPEWDIEVAFDIDSVEWDFDNCEASILMELIE